MVGTCFLIALLAFLGSLPFILLFETPIEHPFRGGGRKH